MERNLQQQVLSWILTKFPFHPAGCANLWGTFPSAKIKKIIKRGVYNIKKKEGIKNSLPVFLYTYIYYISRPIIRPEGRHMLCGHSFTE